MPMEIPFNTGNLSAAEKDLRKLQARLEKLAEAFEKATGAANSFTDAGLDVGSVASGGSSSSGARVRKPPIIKPVKPGPTTQDRVTAWARTMRVNAGPFAPLIGRTADMIEGVTGVKGLGLAAIVATQAVAVWAKAVQSAAESATQLRESWVSGGSGFRNTTVAGSMFPGGIGNRAAAFQNAISGGGAATAFAVQAGINPYGGPFGDVDYNKKYMLALKQIADAGPERGRRIAMAYGQPDMANFALLSKSTQQYALNTRSTGGDDVVRQSAEFEFWVNETKRQATELFRDIMLPSLNMATESMKTFGEWSQYARRGFEMVGGTKTTTGILESALSMIPGIGPMIMKKQISAMTEDVRNATRDRAAQNDHTKAMVSHTRAMNAFTRDIRGGGNRVNQALPPGIPGFDYDDKAKRDAIRTGYY